MGSVQHGWQISQRVSFLYRFVWSDCNGTHKRAHRTSCFHIPSGADVLRQKIIRATSTNAVGTGTGSGVGADASFLSFQVPNKSLHSLHSRKCQSGLTRPVHPATQLAAAGGDPVDSAAVYSDAGYNSSSSTAIMVGGAETGDDETGYLPPSIIQGGRDEECVCVCSRG